MIRQRADSCSLLKKEKVMATTMNRHSQVTKPRTLTQKVSITLGVFFIVVGLGGIVMPGMLGMHLSLLHNIVHLSSGALALWVGYSDDSRKAYTFCIAFGAVYGLLGIAGFVFGSPGFPGVGYMEADDNLLRIIPNAFELGTSDHFIHIFLGVAFIGSVFASRRKGVFTQKRSSGSDRETKGPSDIFRKNSESDLRDASLGRSDINRRIDKSRRNEFETRI
jgi:Domain of unknown function (DUF4383)